MLAHGVLGNSVCLPPATWVYRKGFSCSISSRRETVRYDDNKTGPGARNSSSPGPQQAKNVQDRRYPPQQQNQQNHQQQQRRQQQPHQQSYARICTKYVASSARIAAAAASAASSVTEEPFGVTESGKFTLSDAALSQRGFELLWSSPLLDLDQLNALFAKVGFPRRQKEKLARALEHTMSMVWLREKKTERLVAFARATGDNVFNAIIWDVVVDPAYQGSGLGKVVIERLMADLVRKGISNIALYAEPNVVGFYRPLGFTADPDGIRAMAYQRRPRR